MCVGVSLAWSPGSKENKYKSNCLQETSGDGAVRIGEVRVSPQLVFKNVKSVARC